MSESRKFQVDYSKRLSKCKNSSCKKEIEKGSLRIGKLIPNFMSDDSDTDMKQYYHVECLFDSFRRARASTKIIESPDDIIDFETINEKDKKMIVKKIDGINFIPINGGVKFFAL
jgi:DNA ligase-3